ncbi:hypothetical protein BKA82DRAFT_4366530 [Pisolithus tinctorius]|nr:hypothetical protein BKA82DRAFT_4366530 [Pisolithus tinctorius]
MAPSNTPQGTRLPSMPGLDDPFGSGPAQRRDHGGSSLLSPEFSFDMMEPTGAVDSQGSQDEVSYPHRGNQSSQHLSFTPYHGGVNGHDETSFSYAGRPSHSQSNGRGHSEMPMEDYQTLYSASRSRTGSYQGDQLSLHATVAQLTAHVKHLSEAKTSMEEQLTSIREATESLVSCLETVEQMLGELQEKCVDQQKHTSSRTNSNDHSVLKSIIQPLFSHMCGIECEGTKRNRVAALAAIKPLKNDEPFILTSDSTRLWCPNWLGNVDDKLNDMFIKEVAERVFNNEKSQREQLQLKTIPDKSFDLQIMKDCAKTYFRTIHKRVKEEMSDQGACRTKERLGQNRQRARRVTVATARRKAASQYEAETGHQGAEALILTDLGKDAEVGQSANRVVGHAWRSVDYVAFLRYLSLRAMKQRQDVIEDPNASTSNMDQEPQRKRRKTTKKVHKRVFDVAPKHSSHGPPPAKAMVFRAMVDERWLDEHPGMVVHEGISWLKGFYSRVNQEELFKADATYLKELDEWLKTSNQNGSSDEGDEE